MNPIAKTFHNMGPASTDYEPRHDSTLPRGVDQEETNRDLNQKPPEDEETDYSYDAEEEDIFMMHLGKKMEENY